jgi:hypothetical protein
VQFNEDGEDEEEESEAPAPKKKAYEAIRRAGTSSVTGQTRQEGSGKEGRTSQEAVRIRQPPCPTHEGVQGRPGLCSLPRFRQPRCCNESQYQDPSCRGQRFVRRRLWPAGVERRGRRPQEENQTMKPSGRLIPICIPHPRTWRFHASSLSIAVLISSDAGLWRTSPGSGLISSSASAAPHPCRTPWR